MNNTDAGLRIYELLASDTEGSADDVELLCSAIFELTAEVRRLRDLSTRPPLPDQPPCPPKEQPMSDTEPICVRFPTIMSGVVLRWYRDENAYAAGQQLANAGREGHVVLSIGCPRDVEVAARDASEYIRDAYARRWHPATQIDTSRWETHTADFPSGKLSPIAATSERSR